MIMLRTIAILALFLAFSVTPVCSEERGNAAYLTWENDLFGGTDANYTNGLSAALTQRGAGILGGVWGLFGEQAGVRYSTYEVTQLLFTPNAITSHDQDLSDRPYAGLLYAGLTTHLKDGGSLQSIKLIAGVVGPYSLGEEAQIVSHEIFRSNRPNGWDHQLKNEPVVNLMYEYRHRFAITQRDEPFGVDLIPAASAMLGNLAILGRAGAQVRFGYRLPDDFGVARLRGIGYLPLPEGAGTHPMGIYLFAGASGSLIARDLTLDGNTFRGGPSVDKRPFVPEVEFGTSIRAGRVTASFTYVKSGDEFYGQRVRHDYGSARMSCEF